MRVNPKDLRDWGEVFLTVGGLLNCAADDLVRADALLADAMTAIRRLKMERDRERDRKLGVKDAEEVPKVGNAKRP